MKNVKEILLKIMFSALKASKPDGNFNYIPDKPEGKTIVLGAGKASASMAKAFEKIYPHKIQLVNIGGIFCWAMAYVADSKLYFSSSKLYLSSLRSRWSILVESLLGYVLLCCRQ